MKNKGISLIVLIITIVVIIILAAAIILNLSNTNLIENANQAVVKQDFKTMQDELTLYKADKYADSNGKFDITNVNAYTQEDVIAIIPSVQNSQYKEYITIVNGEIIIKSTMPEPQRTWAMAALNQEKYDIATVDVIVKDNKATINGENPSYMNPVIPVGFMAINTTDASWNDGNGWNNGLVIQDENGNEFVWVPVDGTEITYDKHFEEYPKLPAMTSVEDDTEVIPVSNESEQIIKYGGFYIGRYEAGVPEDQSAIDGTSTETSDVEGIPVTKQGAKVWTYITYNKMVINSKKMYETSKSVKSGMVTGTQWDTVMKWVKNSGVNVSTDCTTWGNYKNSVEPANVTGFGEKQVTGFSEKWKAKNIYDLAGNAWELTPEIYTYNRVMRGGMYDNDGTHHTAAFRNRSVSGNGESISFRIVLYVM